MDENTTTSTGTVATETTITNPGTITSEPSVVGEIEAGANTIADVAAETGNKVAQEADTALHAAENVAGTVQTDLASHAGALRTALDGLSAVAANSTAVAAAVSPAAANIVTTIEQKIAAMTADLGQDIALLFSHLKL